MKKPGNAGLLFCSYFTYGAITRCQMS